MDGYGNSELSVVAVPNPGAGLELNYNVPGAERMLLLGVAFTLTADATAGNRTPVVELIDGTGVTFAAVSAGYALAPSGNARFTFAHGLAEWDQANNAFASGPCPILPLKVGQIVRVHVENLAAADTITAARLTLMQEHTADDDEA